MKVFISWSGDMSKAVAERLNHWLKCVLQATEPWISTEDIAKGSLWFTEISDQLKDTSVGILCLTQDNVNAPWILFEAGALAKGLTKSRVCTLLINLKATDLKPPLSNFNATLPTKDDMFKLVSSINDTLDRRKLAPEIVKASFESFWPSFKADFDKAVQDHQSPDRVQKRSPEELIDEVLQISRQNQATLETLQSILKPQSSSGEWIPSTDYLKYVAALPITSMTPEQIDSLASRRRTLGEVLLKLEQERTKAKDLQSSKNDPE